MTMGDMEEIKKAGCNLQLTGMYKNIRVLRSEHAVMNILSRRSSDKHVKSTVKTDLATLH